MTVASLGMTQTVAWASSYYLPAILADPLAAELDLSGLLADDARRIDDRDDRDRLLRDRSAVNLR